MAKFGTSKPDRTISLKRLQCVVENNNRVTYTRFRIDTIDSPDDEHRGARNMWRTEINIHEKELCIKLIIYKNYTEMFDQKNIKFVLLTL